MCWKRSARSTASSAACLFARSAAAHAMAASNITRSGAATSLHCSSACNRYKQRIISITLSAGLHCWIALTSELMLQSCKRQAASHTILEHGYDERKPKPLQGWHPQLQVCPSSCTMHWPASWIAPYQFIWQLRLLPLLMVPAGREKLHKGRPCSRRWHC